MVFEEKENGILLRVRLTPNSSSCNKGDIFCDADGREYIKINVVSVPEKGKANQELIKFLGKQLKEAKSRFEIVGGETDRCKKILISGKPQDLRQKLEEWLEK